MIVDTFREEFAIWKRTLTAEAATGFRELDRPRGAGRAVPADRGDNAIAAEVIMWESGEADLVVGDPSIRGIVANEHMEIATRLGIRGLLDDITEAINI